MQLPRFLEYMPNQWSLQYQKKIDRNFFFGVLSTLSPEFVEQLVLDIRAQRINSAANRQNNQQQVIGMSQEWAIHLLSQPYVSSK